MEDFEKLRKQLREVLDDTKTLMERAEIEDRNFTDEEEVLYEKQKRRIEDLKKRIRANEPASGSLAPGERYGSGYLDASGTGSGSSGIRVMHDRSYRSMFGNRPDFEINSGGFRSFDEFANLVKLAGQTGVSDDRLTRSFQEGVPSDGGFAVPTEWAQEIFNVSLESEVVRPRARIFPMSSDSKKIPAVEIGSHDSHLYGGLIGYWGSEGGALTDSAVKFRQVELNAKKLYCYGYSSSEWSEDAILGLSLIHI